MKQTFLALALLIGAPVVTYAADQGGLTTLPRQPSKEFEKKNPMNVALFSTAAETVTLDIWPGKAPGEITQLPPEDLTKPEDKLIAGKRIIKLGNVSIPQITVFKPDPAINNGTSVIIAPGGGHHILALDLEGTEIAEWLNTLGITGIVLKYRVPGRNPDKPWKAAVQDSQRAVSLVRAKAEEIGIDPEKIGLMGFSAGAQTAGLTTLFQARQYAPVDGYDQFSFIPNFVGILYLGRDIHEEPGTAINADLPPFFIAVAHNDNDRSISSAKLYIELKQAQVPAELHIYESGGHGYGLRPTEKPVTGWNHVMADWMKQIGMLN
jgi:acetyl esterase/lipase